MPIKRCTLPNGSRGYKWGDHGHCYAERGQAVQQAQAAYASGYRGKKSVGQSGLDMTGVYKGDFPGHPFRGNQWTGGIGGHPKAGEDGSATKLFQESFEDVGLQTVMDNSLTQAEQDELRARLAEIKDLKKAGEETDVKYSKTGKRAETLDDYTAERQKVHDTIIKDYIDRMKNYSPEEGQPPEFIMLAGRGGSGKSNFGEAKGGEARYFDETRFLKLDSDDIKKMLIDADNATGLKPARSLEHVALYHEESSLLSKAIMEIARDNGVNLVFDRTLDNPPKFADLTKMKKAGYKTTLLMMQTPPQDALKSALDRWKAGGPGERGRLVTPEVVYSSRRNEANFDKARNWFEDSQLWTRRGKTITRVS